MCEHQIPKHNCGRTRHASITKNKIKREALQLITGTQISIVQFQKKSIPTPWKAMEIPREKGVLKVKILEAKYEAKLEFPKGMGGAK